MIRLTAQLRSRQNGCCMKPTWAVVATVDEPAALVVTFVAYYLAMGASAVHIFLDQPNAEAEVALRGIARCTLTLCDEEYWTKTLGRKRPPLHVGRQIANANAIYKTTAADWLLHCDCDEFVADPAAMATALAEAPGKAQYMRLPVAERVYLKGETSDYLFDGMFRRPIPAYDLVGPAIYGEDVDYFKDGLTGHKAGKALIRTGLDIEVSIHAPKTPIAHRHIETTYLLHFDGLTRFHYMLKLLRRANEPKVPWVKTELSPRHGAARISQIKQLRDSSTDWQSCIKLVSKMKDVTLTQAQMLRQLGCLEERSFDPWSQLKQLGLSADLSCTGFDAQLLRQNRALLAKYAPDWPDHLLGQQ